MIFINFNLKKNVSTNTTITIIVTQNIQIKLNTLNKKDLFYLIIFLKTTTNGKKLKPTKLLFKIY